MGKGPFELMRDPEEGPYIRALLAAPDDAAARQRYHDWLIARGGPRAELLDVVRCIPVARDDGERAALLAQLELLERDEDELWLALVVREGRIASCGAAADHPPAVRFSYQCPRSWERLAATADPTVRHCDECARPVFLCQTFPEAERHARRGDCISVPGKLVSAAGARYCRMVTGRPDPLAFWARALFE